MKQKKQLIKLKKITKLNFFNKDFKVAKSMKVLLDRLIKMKTSKNLKALCRHLYKNLKIQTSFKTNVKGYDKNLLIKLYNDFKKVKSRIDKIQNNKYIYQAAV